MPKYDRYHPDYGRLYPEIQARPDVLSVLKKSDRKMEYMEVDIKQERFSYDPEGKVADLLPSREDSYERLLAANHQFASAGPSPEEEAVSSLWLADLMRGLSPEEQDIITQLYILDKSERQACAALQLARTTFQRRKKALLEKLRNLLSDNS